MKYFKPIATLMAISTFMPELVTGSTTLFAFLNPISFLVNFFAYGVTILLIREFYVRYNLSFFGLFLLGIAYVGINEGLIAKTIILENGIPWNLFDHYGYIAGISVPWTLVMAVWHSVCSVMFPVLATHFLFAETSRDVWLGKKTSLLLAMIPLAIGFLFFFSPFRGVGTGGQLIIILGGMIALTVASVRFGKKKEEVEHHPVRRGFVWLGVSTVLFWTVALCFIVVGLKLPLIIFFAVLVGGVMWYVNKLKKMGMTNDTLLLFILGAYLQTAVTGLLIALFLTPMTLGERLPAELIILVVSTVLLRKVFKRHRELAM